MKWLRLWTKLLTSTKAQDLPPALFKHWINLLCVANQNEKRGYLPDEGQIAMYLRVPRTRVGKILADLEERRMLNRDGASWRPHDWDDWQRQSDNAAERMANTRRTSSADVRNNDRTSDELPSASASVSSSRSTSEGDSDDVSRERDSEDDRNLRARLFLMCEQNIGSVTPSIAAELDDWIGRAPEKAIEYAFREAALANIRNWRYVSSILRRQEEQGWPAPDEEAPDDDNWVDDAMRAAS